MTVSISGEFGRDELLSLVTHEIKNPLTSITGYTHFAEDAVKHNDPDSALESLAVVRNEAGRILRLAEDLLDMSSLRAGKFAVFLEAVDIAEVIRPIAAKYAKAGARKIELEIPENLPCANADPLRISQVIENLISNAVKYSPEDSPIRVSVECDDDVVRISVTNWGPKIPDEQLSQLFQRFSRLRRKDDRDHHGNGHSGNGNGNGNGSGNGAIYAIKGTGLGLFICKEIVKTHGGKITVDSSEKDGTRFTVELPR